MSIQAAIIVHLIRMLDGLRAELMQSIPGGPKVDHIEIIFLESNMADVQEGSSIPFVVKGFNKKGNEVPVTDATVSIADPVFASATVNADGTNGVLTGIDGDGSADNNT